MENANESHQLMIENSQLMQKKCQLNFKQSVGF